MHESTEPPSYPPPRDWACPSGNVVPGEDDREVTFPRGGRVPTGPQLPPTSPAPAGPDMGQLISTLTSGLQIGTPKISTFSGKVAPGKTEVSYEQWSHEVQCVKDHYPESVVRESIMQSLKGAAVQIWPATWVLLPVSLTFWKNYRSYSVQSHHLTY